MKLIIAEKPELGRDIARAVCGAPADVRLPYTGGGYMVVNCIGHLLRWAEPADVDPDAYGNRRDLAALPILLEPWPRAREENKSRALANIERGLAACDGVIHAGDPDDEGQFLVDEVLDFLGYTGKVERVYVNDNLEKNIRKAFENLRDNEECRGDGEAAAARSIADFCFGINESRLISARTGGAAVSVGRVQTPTLGLIVRRDEEILAHRSVPYYIGRAAIAVDGRELSFKFKPAESLLDAESKKCLDKAALMEAMEDLAPHGDATATVERKSWPAPLPYNLTDLTADMSRRYKMGAKAVLDATQSLRDDHHAITYNRSDCNYLPEAAHAEAPAVLGVAMANIGATWDLDFSIKGRCFNDANITAHAGIIPQEARVDASKLTTAQRRVYEAVVERYAMQFAGDTEGRVSTCEIAVPRGRFEHRAVAVDDPGWRRVRDDGAPEKDAEEGWIEAGPHTWERLGIDCEEKKTRPRPPYTEGTLMKDMASIAKYVSDPEIARVLKEKDAGKKGEHGGIGTSATRAATIEKLKEHGYVEEIRGKLVSTELGRSVYHACPADIRGADVTARWWLMCEEVRAGRADRYSVARSVCEVFESHRDTAYIGFDIKRTVGEEVGRCPVCGKPVLDRGPKSKAFSCSTNTVAKVEQEDGTVKWERTGGCGFQVWKRMAGRAVSAAQVRKLLARGKTDVIKGFVGKSGKPFDARIVLKDDKTLGFEFPERKGGSARAHGTGRK